MATDYPISIIIPLWNGERFIGNCLDSLFQTIPANAEVIVVDNGSNDNGIAHVEEYPAVHLIRNTINMGFSAAINQGLAKARGDCLFLLNQDTVAHKGWFEAVQARFAHESQLGIVGCRLLYPDGTLQHAGGRLLEPTWMTEHAPEDFAGRLDFVTGAAFAIRRRCYNDVGLFDTGFYPAYYEDVDYCLRARLKGWDLACELEAVLTHYESQSRGDDFNIWLMHGVQRLRLVLKHRALDWLQNVFFEGEYELLERSWPPDWHLAMAAVYLRSAQQLQLISLARQNVYGVDDHSTILNDLHRQLLLLRQRALAQWRASEDHAHG